MLWPKHVPLFVTIKAHMMGFLESKNKIGKKNSFTPAPGRGGVIVRDNSKEKKINVIKYKIKGNDTCVLIFHSFVTHDPMI